MSAKTDRIKEIASNHAGAEMREVLQTIAEELERLDEQKKDAPVVIATRGPKKAK